MSRVLIQIFQQGRRESSHSKYVSPRSKLDSESTSNNRCLLPYIKPHIHDEFKANKIEEEVSLPSDEEVKNVKLEVVSFTVEDSHEISSNPTSNPIVPKLKSMIQPK